VRQPVPVLVKKAATVLDIRLKLQLRREARASPSKVAETFPMVTTSPTSIAPKAKLRTPQPVIVQAHAVKVVAGRMAEDEADVITVAVVAAVAVAIATAAAVEAVGTRSFEGSRRDAACCVSTFL
jgi:hypothetical protein